MLARVLAMTLCPCLSVSVPIIWQSDYGLHIGSLFIGSILYADDIALLACSCCGLQQLINICNKYGMQWDIRFNPQKASWHALAEIPLVITSLLLEISTCLGLRR